MEQRLMLMWVQKFKKKCVRKRWYLESCYMVVVKMADMQKSIIGNSVICEEIIETTKIIVTKTVPAKSISTNLDKKKVICKMKSFYIILAFLLITATMLIVASIYCFIRYWEKQKHLLTFHDASIIQIEIKNYIIKM